MTARPSTKERIMKEIARIVPGLFGIFLLAAMGFGAWLGLKHLYAFFAALDRDVANITAILCLSVLAAAWVIARSLGASNRQGKALALRQEKTAAYQLFVDFWESLLRRGRTQNGQLPADLAGKLHMLDRLLALYGGTAVIKAHTALRNLERDKGLQHPDVRARLGEALVAIRRDLGADTPLNAAHELERLLLPAPEAVDAAAAEARDARFRTVLAPHS